MGGRTFGSFTPEMINEGKYWAKILKFQPAQESKARAFQFYLMAKIEIDVFGNPEKRILMVGYGYLMTIKALEAAKPFFINKFVRVTIRHKRLPHDTTAIIEDIQADWSTLTVEHGTPQYRL